VVEDPAGKPLRKVDVHFMLHGEPNNDEHSTTTDAEGAFEIENLKPGRYRVILDRVGYVPVEKRSRFGINLTLSSAEDAKGLVLHMQAAAVITGKIVDKDGDPIPNASVQAMPPGPGRFRMAAFGAFGNTNDLGEFRLANLRPGKYVLMVTAIARPRPPKPADPQKDSSQATFNYAATFYPGTLDKAQALALELHPGDETPVTFSPLESQTFSIRGTVAKPAGAMVAQVFLRALDGSDAQQNTSVAEDGSFEFHDLLPGVYLPYLIAMDASVMTEVQQGHTPQMQIMRLGRPLEITNANLEGVRWAPEAPGRVRGRFRLDKGQKIDWTQLGVSLTPMDLSSQFMSSGMPSGFSMAPVKPDGSFDFPNVVAGDYRVGVTSNAPALQDYFTKSVNLDGKDMADSGFTVSGGSYALDVVVGSEGGTIEGTVVDTKSNPVPDVTVISTPNGERRKRFDLFGRATTDAQGHFRLRGLVPGEYTVLAWEEVDEDTQDPEVLKAYQDRGQQVQIGEGATKSISLKVIPAGDDIP
jgi:protocatechuate 3,4-dioxygenase beta subunit